MILGDNNQKGSENNFDFVAKRDGKKRHKEKKNKSEIDAVADAKETLEVQKSFECEVVSKMMDTEGGDQGKKRNRKHKKEKERACITVISSLGEEGHQGKEKMDKHELEETSDIAIINNFRGEDDRGKKMMQKDKQVKESGIAVTRSVTIADEVGKGKQPLNGQISEKDKGLMTKKAKKKKRPDDFSNSAVGDHVSLEYEDNGDSAGSQMETRMVDVDDREENKDKKKRKKKAKYEGGYSEGNAHKEVAITNTSGEITYQSENSKPKESSKKVTFSDHDDMKIYHSVVRGKHFSKEEDKLIKEAVSKYIEVHKLGEDGLNKILNCRYYREVRECWKEIGAALPWRHFLSVYLRGHSLFERDENRTWSAEECELIRRYVEKHGTKWKTLASALGKHRIHVKDTWRRIKLANRKRGRWSQGEYQTLFDLVNMDLCTKASEEKESKQGMLQDNIFWGAISDKLSTRASPTCCLKWYHHLASPMVAEGKWADADDYRLLHALSSLDACCMEDVDWDNILEHRSGDICRKRWNQMVQHIGHHGSQSFAEQVEVLANRYRPD